MVCMGQWLIWTSYSQDSQRKTPSYHEEVVVDLPPIHPSNLSISCVCKYISSFQCTVRWSIGYVYMGHLPFLMVDEFISD